MFKSQCKFLNRNVNLLVALECFKFSQSVFYHSPHSSFLQYSQCFHLVQIVLHTMEYMGEKKKNFSNINTICFFYSNSISAFRLYPLKP